MCSSIADMSKQQELLQGAYSSYITPWITSTQQLELPNTGPLIHEANTKLATLTKVGGCRERERYHEKRGIEGHALLFFLFRISKLSITSATLRVLPQVLKAIQDASNMCEELAEREKAIMRHAMQPSSVTSTLHTLVSQSNTSVNVVR